MRWGAQAAEKPIRIAFIDSGISTKHISDAQVDAGQNYVFPESDNRDRIGHGPATAGLVLGAEDQGVSGLCPGAVAVPLVVVDAYPSGAEKNGGPEALTQAIYDAVDLYDCRIINVSLCTLEDTPELRAAAAYAESHGVIVFAAAGNDEDVSKVGYPAAYETVLSVGAAEGETAAAFSVPGADLLAAGVGLRTATNSNGAAPATVQGTSYACAVATAVCARLLQTHPSLTPAQARSALCALAQDILAPGFDSESGWGLLAGTPRSPRTFPRCPRSSCSRPLAPLTGRKKRPSTALTGNPSCGASRHTPSSLPGREPRAQQSRWHNDK